MNLKGYLENSIHLQESRLTTERELNKSLLTLSSGALALSITIIQFLITVDLSCLIFLYLSWIFLSFSMLLCLLFYKNKTRELEFELNELKHNYMKSVSEKFEETIENDIKEKIKNDIYKFNISNKSKNIIQILKNKITTIIITFLLTGIGFLTIFTFLNLHSSG